MTKLTTAIAATALLASSSMALAQDMGMTAIALSGDNMLHKIDVATATVSASMEVKGASKLLAVIVDFNPMANKLRFMTGTTNHRVDIESGAVTVDGSLAYEDADMHAGEAPAIVAAAYINSYGKPESTAMYDIDSTIVALIQQTSPNDGTLGAIGKLGIEASDTYAFDIATDAEGTNTAWLVAGSMLYTVSLESGAVDKSWELKGTDGATVRDITFMTAM